ncbi:TRAP transporter small permease subunit [Deferribacter autotrophicus]|uniref:TRAP transporter small permease subunit n=1 Tax=Deferribacter autotrophicus TaxID=500465 RepID=A0A5A8F896_9BACT|nr:TRAP transporter small permease subunit [Deferribacter autotrophicus]KAA0258582.1 TRAP transporter small permease subunit [Deferribacter autotrophicus]
MKLIAKIMKIIDMFNEWFGNIVIWISTLMVLVVCYDVTTRYVFNKSSVAVQELEWHLFGFLFLLGAAYTLKHDRHVRVDVFYDKLTEKKKAVIDIIGTLLFLIPFSILVIYTSKNFVINSFLIKEGSPNPGGLPYRFILKSAIPVGFFLVLLQGISLLIRNFLILTGKKEYLEGSQK